MIILKGSHAISFFKSLQNLILKLYLSLKGKRLYSMYDIIHFAT